jgi:hypothetical protein
MQRSVRIFSRSNHIEAWLAAAGLACLAVSLLAACGGSKAAPPPDSPEASSSESSETSVAAAEPSDEPAPPPPAPKCDDGSCFECGEGLCPKGFYCDASAQGGPACSWLPECAKDPSCACLKKELGKDCNCESGAGGPQVTCQ